MQIFVVSENKFCFILTVHIFTLQEFFNLRQNQNLLAKVTLDEKKYITLCLCPPKFMSLTVYVSFHSFHMSIKSSLNARVAFVIDRLPNRPTKLVHICIFLWRRFIRRFLQFAIRWRWKESILYRPLERWGGGSKGEGQPPSIMIKARGSHPSPKKL